MTVLQNPVGRTGTEFGTHPEGRPWAGGHQLRFGGYPEELRRPSENHLFPDFGCRVADHPRIRNLERNGEAGLPQYGIPRPGTYIVDSQGKIVSKYFEEDFRERVSISDILAGQFGARVDASGGAVEAKHVRLSTTASTLMAHAGHRILLTLDLDLTPKMHVYAPGVTGYIPIDWEMEETGAAKVRPVQYPAAEKLRLEPIHETALVYQGRVRMTREITFGPENALKPRVSPSGEVVLKGSLRYQACDDRECYVPETVPVEWRFRFEALDRERVPAELQRTAR